MFFGNIIERIRLLDTESLVLALLLLITSRLASLFSQNQMLILIAAISAFSITLLLGAKLSKLFVSHIKYENSSLLIIALTPFFGLGFVYLTWMITASFSSFAPIVVTSLSFFCLLFTPSLHIRRIFLQKMRLSNIESSRKILPYIVILIIQLILMLATSIALTGIGNNIWLRTIYDGFPLWGYVCIFVVIGITFFLSLAGSKFWFISITAVGIWARTFMLSAGFVHFGGDDGENIAIVKMLANGNITPFLNLSENLSNWRYGSFQTLSFHSNMAFTSSLANLNPDFSAGALAVAVSTLLLVIGAYALSRTILNNSRAYRLAILFIMIFSPAAMWWQFRFDPNLLVSVLFPAYLAVVLLLPYSKSGLVLFLFSTFFLFSVHPLSLALILPCAIYKIAVFLLEVKKNIKISAAKSGILLILFMIVALILLLVPNLFIGVLRLFSATGFFGLSPGSGLQIGNYVSQSSLLNSYYPTYTLSFLSVVFGIISFVVFWKILKNDFSKKIKASILISSTIVIELLVLDFFLQPSDSFPAYRLWTVIPTIFAPITASLIVFLKYLPVSSFKLSKLSISVPKSALWKLIVVVLLGLIITVSFVQSAYPTGQSLNLDTITAGEHDLLVKLTSSVALTQSLILAEYPTMRYLIGMIGNWPATRNYGNDDRVTAFVDLAYYGQIDSLLKLAAENNASQVYVVVLNRYAGPKVLEWYGGQSYVSNLTSFGIVDVQNSAGYVLKIDTSKYGL